MAVSVIDIQVNSQQAVSRIRDVNNASRQAQSSIDGLTRTVRNLVGAYAAFNAVKFVFTQAAEIESQTRSLQVLTGSVKQAKQIIEELQQLGAVTPFTSTELIDAAKRLQAFGVEAGKVVETTRRLADASGATGAELQGLVTAYGQVQAKGRLQGEELLQFQERGIALQEELRKMYGMTSEEFQDALSKGRISAKAVEVALQRLTDAGGKYANGAIAQSDTLNGKLSTLQDSFQRLAANIGKFFEPAFKFLIDGVNAVIERLNNASRLGAEARAFQQAGERTKARFGARVMNPFDEEVQQYRKRLEKSLVQTEMQMLGGGGRPAPRAPSAPAAIPALLGATGGGRAGGADKAAREAERAAEAAAKEAERVAEVVRLRTAEGQFIRLKSELQDKISAAENAGDKQLVARLQGQQRELDIQFQYAKELANEKNIRAQQSIIFEAQNALVANQRDTQRELNELQNQSAKDQIAALEALIGKTIELTDQQKQQQELADSIANTVGQGMTSAFDALIQGSEDFGASLRKIASGVLIDIAKQLLQVFIIQKAINAISGLFGGGGGGAAIPTSYAGVQVNPLQVAALPSFGTGFQFAKGGIMTSRGPLPLKHYAAGGVANSPQLAMFGEGSRPEAYVPLPDGRSIPVTMNGQGGNVNVVVNVDASGSQVQGNEGQAKALGGAISAAVQAEIIKQQRPGGLLAGTR